ncbi:hypothetical protein POSPLADRAFT_1043992 [Postia placenta MAD-698-R-SB12]|uniref:FAD-binding domain-containing protein n=1 Tax=Postia placenta MAD-698-R-SB12 TaxID=670580 RepID=A0A1X6NDG9_9APHY|nr:hypothetical protein POSPLADRAFT_1043992 [Postia placenta MAD-698-R-SB12]OSX66614.1 hypothetical protein POSPLADRAFT_1043992 [Postia placenta MAD-698-R-SB12]
MIGRSGNNVAARRRLGPNVTKILYRWGFEEKLKACAVVSQYTQFMRYMRKFLYDAAVEHGTTVRTNAQAVEVKVRRERPSVILASGEEISADCIVGADGAVDSLCRKVILGGPEHEVFKNVMMFNLVIAASSMQSDPELAKLLKGKEEGTVYVWYGDSYGVTGFMTQSQSENEFSLHIYAPREEGDEQAKRAEGSAKLMKALTGCEPRHVLLSVRLRIYLTSILSLRKLAERAHTVIAVPVSGKAHMQEWTHPDGPVLIVGDAAHPITAGNMYAMGLAAEDGMMLGRLFHHLHRKDQIQSFLAALSTKRMERIAKVNQVQRVNPLAMALPAGVEQARYLKTTVEHMDNAMAVVFLEEAIRTIFSYDPEDEADDWWVEWGLLQDRAARTVPSSAAITVDIHT